MTNPPGLRAQLAALTGAKTVANTALRWIGPFLPTLERAFGASTGAMTAVIGAAELGGLTTSLTGRALDTGHQRRLFLAGLCSVALSSTVALIGTLWWFAVSMVLLVVGVSNLTVAGHAWISGRVEYARRGRAIGVFELSWALALLLGAPILALLIERWGWRGPFVALAVGSTVAALVVVRRVPADDGVPRTVDPARRRGRADRLPRSAWNPLLASALTGGAGLAVFVVSGTWLADRHGVSTGGLGLVAMVFGALELASSGSSAMWADRLGKVRSVGGGLVILLVGLAIIAVSGDALVLAILGLTVFLSGFEFAFVTSLSLVSEAAPAARGRALGIGNALGTVARAGTVFVGGQLYEAVGIGGTLALSATVAAVALGLVAASPRPHELRSTRSSTTDAT